MGMTIRMGVVGLMGLSGLWSCGGTVTHGDPDSSDTDTSGSPNGTGGDGSGDFGNNDGSGGASTGTGGGSDTTGDDSASAVTTRGSGSRNNSASSTTSGSSDASSATVNGSSGVGISSATGGQVVTSSGGLITVGSSVSTTVSIGSGGFGGDPTNGVSTFNSISVVTSTTGSGGTGSTSPDLEDFPYLDDCDSSYWSVSSQYCNLGFECPSHVGWTNCWDLGNGELSCDCGRDYFWANYRLSASNTEDACAYTASACVAGPDVEGQPACTPSYLYQSTNYCNATATCQTKVDIEGADIVKTGSHYVYCEQLDDAWRCDCDIADGRVSVTLDASSGSSDMCVDALDWCSGEITREGPRDCTPSSQYAETNSCYVNLRCSQAAVAGGVPATITESFTLNCRHDDAGKWICDCPGMGSFEVEAETGWDACTLGASECSPV